MFDPDKNLSELKFRELDPPAGLADRTLAAMSAAGEARSPGKAPTGRPEESGHQKGGNRNMKKRFAYGLSTAAVLAIGIFIGAGVFGGDDPAIAGYYTVDINPSVCIGVDASDKVAETTSQNEDGAKLLEALDLSGMAAGEAIPEIIEKARELGYITSGDQYVLVGYFSPDGTFSSSLQFELESRMNEMVQLLLVSGTLANKGEADSLGVSAGLLALSRQVEGVTVKSGDGVADVVAAIKKCQEPQPEPDEPTPDSGKDSTGGSTGGDTGSTTPDPYISTTISGSLSDKSVTLRWNAIDRDRLDGYKVMYSFTDSTPVYGESGCTYYAWITDPATVKVIISDVTKLSGYGPGKACWFSITALYDGHSIKKAGNAIKIIMPDYPVAEYKSSTISGSLSGGTVNLSWTPVGSDGFKYYKVMYSFCDDTPVYGEADCYYYDVVSDPTDTARAVDITKLNGYLPGTPQTCWFSITAVYEGVKKPGNAIKIEWM